MAKFLMLEIASYFNSIKVQLELLLPIASACCSHFNSIKVQLERCASSLVRFLLPFQFHKGTIRTPTALIGFGSPRHFNSIKVQLELPRFLCDRILDLFQFHKGTIRTRRGR